MFNPCIYDVFFRPFAHRLTVSQEKHHLLTQVSFHFAMQADNSNHLIRYIILSSSVVSTLAGQAGITGSTNGVGTHVIFCYPRGIALDAAGTFAVVVSVYLQLSLVNIAQPTFWVTEGTRSPSLSLNFALFTHHHPQTLAVLSPWATD